MSTLEFKSLQFTEQGPQYFLLNRVCVYAKNYLRLQEEDTDRK